MQTSNRFVLTALVLLVLGVGIAPAQTNGKSVQKAEPTPTITFVELGSVKCVPCRMMQPVMKNIEKKYGAQVKVIFYDIW